MNTLPSRVGVYGGGRMGAGIAHILLTSGTDVTIVEPSPDAADAARTRVQTSLAKGQAEPTGSLTVTADPADLAATTLVIEAVPEIPDLKASVLARIEQAAPNATIATNTSSLSIDGLAGALTAPERLIGLHFFNPVPVSTLVEIVVGADTPADLVQSAQDWVRALGKTAITVRDSPGFASSRLGVILAVEAMRMLDEGVASAEDIDTAMALGYKHPIGPLRTTDIVGLDVRLDIAEHLARELGPRFEPPQVLRDHVQAGRLGRKSGQGFYRW